MKMKRNLVLNEYLRRGTKLTGHHWEALRGAAQREELVVDVMVNRSRQGGVDILAFDLQW
jgi:hypothetical protein